MHFQARTRQIAMRSAPPNVANRRSAAICKPRQNILWFEAWRTPWVGRISSGGFFVTDVANCESRTRSRPSAMNVNVAHNNALRQLNGAARNRRAERHARGITTYDRQACESRGKCGKCMATGRETLSRSGTSKSVGRIMVRTRPKGRMSSPPVPLGAPPMLMQTYRRARIQLGTGSRSTKSTNSLLTTTLELNSFTKPKSGALRSQ